jgi:hypothetical protein
VILVAGHGKSAVVLAATVLSFHVGAAASTAAVGQTDVFHPQIELIAAADLIRGADGEGYAGISVSERKGELELYWNGKLPADVERIVDDVRRDVGVRVLPAAHSERELLAVARRLASEPGVTSVGPKADGSGLRLGYAGDAAAFRARWVVRDAGVAVDVEREEYTRPTQPDLACQLVPINRQNDACPYNGGGWFNPTRCSTGWSVERRNQASGLRQRWLLTAGHCGNNGLTVLDGGGATIGTVEGDADNRDTMLIKTRAAGRIFVGGWNSPTTKPVRQAAGNHVNTLVCTSGAMSGQHCDIRVSAVNQTVNMMDNAGQVRPVFPMVIASSDTGTVAVAGGDSGGPVAAQDSSVGGGIMNVYAAGTISGGAGVVPCPAGSTARPGATCYRQVIYAPLVESLAFYGVGLMTG